MLERLAWVSYDETVTTLEATAAEPTGDRSELPRDESSAALYVVLEGARPLAGGARISLFGVREITIGRGKTLSARRDGGTLVVEVPDDRVSSVHARLVAGANGFVLEDAGSRNGTWVASERITRHPLVYQRPFSVGAVVFVVDAAPPGEGGFVLGPSLVGLRQGLASLVPRVSEGLGKLARIADSDLSVLLLGESGTGKEVLARAVHDLSPRASGPFVAVNCAALPATLLESQLFGHTKGAFSGAVRDEPGLFRAASGGTLFLDEIGDLPEASQPALLRVLETREVTPVGATRPIKVDVRVVSATLRDEQRLRDDLRIRLAGYTHRLAPLRDRRADLGLLLHTLLPRVAAERARDVRFSAEAARAIGAHDWPLNVRELFQAAKSAVVLAGEKLVIERADLPTALTEPAARIAEERAVSTTSPARPVQAKAPVPAEERQKRLVELLQLHAGNVSEVARQMGTTRVQVHRWLEKFEIDVESLRAGKPK